MAGGDNEAIGLNKDLPSYYTLVTLISLIFSMPPSPHQALPPIAVTWQEGSDRPLALSLARELHLPLAEELPTAAYYLAMRNGILQLEALHPGSPGPLSVDFTNGATSYRRRHGGGRRQLLARAVGLKKNRCPLVLDATAGLGRDAFVLASLGCTVTLLERSPLLHALLANGLRRAQDDAALSTIVSRMRLAAGDALSHAPAEVKAEVIYLDPMYPHRSKSSLVKKEMRLTRALVGDDPDADELLAWALACPVQRVVVKRPKGAPFLGNKKPPLTLKSKNSRFDVYFPEGACQRRPHSPQQCKES